MEPMGRALNPVEVPKCRAESYVCTVLSESYTGNPIYPLIKEDALKGP